MTCGTSGRSLLSANLSFLALGWVLFFADSGAGTNDDDDVPDVGGGGGADATGVAAKLVGGIAAGEDPLLSPGRKAAVCLTCFGVVASHTWR